eukprot:6479138-Amphidinium_carterae.2
MSHGSRQYKSGRHYIPLTYSQRKSNICLSQQIGLLITLRTKTSWESWPTRVLEARADEHTSVSATAWLYHGGHEHFVHADPEDFMVQGDAQLFWHELSARCSIVSWLVSLGRTKTDSFRFVGRWGAGASDVYVCTAQKQSNVQVQLAAAMKSQGVSAGGERLLMADHAKWLRKGGLKEPQVTSRVAAFEPSHTMSRFCGVWHDEEILHDPDRHIRALTNATRSPSGIMLEDPIYGLPGASSAYTGGVASADLVLQAMQARRLGVLVVTSSDTASDTEGIDAGRLRPLAQGGLRGGLHGRLPAQGGLLWGGPQIWEA